MEHELGLTALFNHPADFPLTNGHAGVNCVTCHAPGVTLNPSTTCVACHLNKYQATTAPNHTAAGYGTNCQSCHTTKTWLGAVFNHPFPLTGPHQVACNQCHPNLATPTVFVCTTCHTAASTNPRHSDVSGYVWNSAACYRCHSSGRTGDIKRRGPVPKAHPAPHPKAHAP